VAHHANADEAYFFIFHSVSSGPNQYSPQRRKVFAKEGDKYMSAKVKMDGTARSSGQSAFLRVLCVFALLFS
jgi:hypothetical protein